MNETDALGLELIRAHRGNQLGASARGEDEYDAAAIARVAARGSDEIGQRCIALAACDAAALVWILAAGGSGAIRRIGDDQIKARGLDAGDFFLSKVGVDRMHRFQTIDCGAASDHVGERRLNFDRDDFARTVETCNHHRDNAASGAQFEYSVARVRTGEAGQKDCFDRETVAMLWLDQRYRTIEDGIASFVFVV